MLKDIKGLNSTGQILCWWEKGRQGGFQHWGVFTPVLCPAWAVLEGVVAQCQFLVCSQCL